ncbi:Heme peroxidase-like protein, partial [Leptotrombidium deliense]
MYSSLDGSCNNLKSPIQGKSYTCHRRLLPPDYADGIYKIRESVLGGPLPNARLISNEVLLDVERLDYTVTQMNMQWGQFIIHDQT